MSTVVKFVEKVVMVVMNSYTNESYSVLLKNAEVRREYNPIWDNTPEWNTLEHYKKYYSNNHSAILQFGKSQYLSDRIEMLYVNDINIGELELTFNEKQVRELLSNEEWEILFKEGIVEPSQVYVERNHFHYTKLAVL